MMTVLYKPMRRRRWMRIEAGQAPPTWKTFPMHDKGVQGSAKPGRGGRRKRKTERAKIRARIGQRVERKGWPLSWALRKWMIVKGPARTWTDAEIAALVHGPFFVLPAGCELQILEPKILGRRERRRRAKLRRRRARRDTRRLSLPPKAAQLFAQAIGWADREIMRTIAGETSLEHATGPALDRLAEMYGMKRIPGA